MEIFRKQKENFRDFARGLQERRVLVVCDANTEPFTENIGRTLSAAGKEISLFRFPDRHLVPEIGRLKELFAAAEGADYLLGVGSGVINDICKYLSAKTEKPCGILATAPSMDGYVSGVSALYENGRKVTLPAAPPREALIDVNILANAPLDMIVAGAGDLIGKHTSLLDWKLARDLKGEKYDAEIVARMEKALSLGMESAKKLVLRDSAAVETLIDGLLLSGIEMQRAGNSRPASGSEHHISHYLEMKGEEMGKDFAPHGVKVALGCLVSAAMYKYAAGEYAELSLPARGDRRAARARNAFRPLSGDRPARKIRGNRRFAGTSGRNDTQRVDGARTLHDHDLSARKGGARRAGARACRTICVSVLLTNFPRRVIIKLNI